MKYLYIFFISASPFFELRGALFYAWLFKSQLDMLAVSIIAILGNVVIVPFAFYFFKKILAYFSKFKHIGSIFRYTLKRGEEAGIKLSKSNYIYLALALFIGIPLPGTGVWTGVLAADILKLNFFKTFISCIIGTIISCIIVNLSLYSIIKFII